MGWAKFQEDIERKRDELLYFANSIEKANDETWSHLELKSLEEKLRDYTKEFLELLSGVIEIAKEKETLDIAQENFHLRKRIQSLEDQLSMKDLYKGDEVKSNSIASKILSAERTVKDKLSKKHQVELLRKNEEIAALKKKINGQSQALKICRSKATRLNRELSKSNEKLAAYTAYSKTNKKPKKRPSPTEKLRKTRKPLNSKLNRKPDDMTDKN